MSTFKPIPKGEHAITPYLAIKGADAAIQFYQRVFGAKEIGRLLGPDGAIAHAELQIGDSKIMLAEESLECNKSPTTLGDTPVTITLYVDDVDATFKAALDAGLKKLCQSKMSFMAFASVCSTILLGTSGIFTRQLKKCRLKRCKNVATRCLQLKTKEAIEPAIHTRKTSSIAGSSVTTKIWVKRRKNPSMDILKPVKEISTSVSNYLTSSYSGVPKKRPFSAKLKQASPA